MQTRTASGSLKRKAEVQKDDLIDDQAEDTPPKTRSRGKSQKTVHDTNASNPKGKEKAPAFPHRGRNTGKLAKLLDMPVDIFCEISRYLGPLDLLQLARSSRNFNHMLMSRNSRPIWRAARETYPDLPDCPPDLSEPEYARLMFMKECHICLKKGVLKEKYDNRTRLCSRCQHSHILKGERLLGIIPGLTQELLSCIPGGNPWSLFDPLKHYFFTESAKKIVKQYSQAVPPTLPSPEAEKARTEFFSYRKSLISGLDHNARMLGSWSHSQSINKQRTDKETAQRRDRAIHAKLLELGYTEKDIPHNGYITEWTKLCEQPRDLTPRIWKNIQPKLERLLADYKVQRENSERLSRKNARRRELQSHLQPMLDAMKLTDSSLHVPMDIAMSLPTCVSLMSENDYHENITEEKWFNFRQRISNEAHDTIKKIEQHLLSSIATFQQARPECLIFPKVVNREFLLDPSTQVTCQTCRKRTNYLYIREHRCCWLASGLSVLDFDAESTAVAQVLLASLPEGETIDQVRDRSLTCNICNLGLTWDTMLRHFYSEGMKHTPRHSDFCPNAHVLQESLKTHRTLFTINNNTSGPSHEGEDDDEWGWDPQDDYWVPPDDDHIDYADFYSLL